MKGYRDMNTLGDALEGIVNHLSTSIEGVNDIPIVDFAEEIVFNKTIKIFPQQKALLRAFYNEPLDQQDIDILSYWKELNRTTWVQGREYTSLVLEAGRRSSKSSLSSIIILKELYDLLSLPNPGRHFGLLPSDPIAIFVFSQTLDQVSETLFGKLRGWALYSNYFRNLQSLGILEILREEFRSDEKNVGVYAKHTNTAALVGYAIKLLVLDEVARFSTNEEGKNTGDLIWDNIGAGCLHKDSYLYTDRGYLKASEALQLYEEGKELNLVTYSQKTGAQLVTSNIKLWDNGIQPTIRVTTKSGKEETLTYEHPLLVWRNDWDRWKWVKIKDCVIGDTIAISKTLPFLNQKQSIGLDKAKLLGYLWGDGGVSTGTVRFTNTNPEVIKDIQGIISRQFPECELVPNKNNPIQFTIPSRVNKFNPLIRWLNDLKLMGIKAPQKRIPSCITSGTKEEVAAFLNGLFACDGFVPKHNTKIEIGINLSSLGLIQDIQRELIRFGIYSTYRYKANREGRIVRGKPLAKTDGWYLEIGDKLGIEKLAEEIGITGKESQLNTAYKKAKARSIDASTCEFNMFPLGVANYIKKVKSEKGLSWEDMKIDPHVGQGKNRPTVHMLARIACCLDDVDLQNLVLSDIGWESIEKLEHIEPTDTVGLEVCDTGIIGNPIISHNTATFKGTGKDAGKKIAISSAWHDKDNIERLRDLAEQDPTILAFNFRTWDLNPNMSRTDPIVVSAYAKDPVHAQLEWEGIRSKGKGNYLSEQIVKPLELGSSAFDAREEDLEVTAQGVTRYYVGLKVNRIEPLNEVSFGHVDFGLRRDAAAFAMAHPVQIGDGLWGVQVDGYLRWAPKMDKDIGAIRNVSFMNVEELLLQVHRYRPFHLITFDQYNSAGSIQRLHSQGILTDEVGVSNSFQFLCYDTTKDLATNGLLILPKDSIWTPDARNELTNIEIKESGEKQKVTHKVAGKDLADAIANSVYQCYKNLVSSGKMNNLKPSISTINASMTSNGNSPLGNRKILTPKSLGVGSRLKQTRRYLWGNK